MRRSLALVAMWLFVSVSPVTASLILGDQSYRGSTDLDYMFEPLPLTDGQRLAITVIVTLITAGAVVLCPLAYRARLLGSVDLRLALPILLVGVYCGGAYRMMTAGVIGANIGGGLVLMAAPVFLLPTLVWFGYEFHQYWSDRWH